MSLTRNNKRSARQAPAVVTAPTLKEAYRLVRAEYGANAVILGSRTVHRRDALGLGQQREIEVTVQVPGGATASPARPLTPAYGVTDSAEAVDTHAEIVGEVSRIEEMVAAIVADYARLAKGRLPYCDNVVAETLVENGASPEAVNTLLTRFVSETGGAVQDRPAVLAWLAENLRTSNCRWEDFYGCHAFLGETGSGRTEMILAAAALLCGLGRRTLVLSLMPRDNGDIRRLQLEASQNGFDAAVIKKSVQLENVQAHLGDYDVVLVDMPHLRHQEMGEGGVIHNWLAENTSFHRHLLVPLDKDPRDLDYLREGARRWHCDWIAVSRSDLTVRSAKLLDVLETMPIPLSLIGGDPAGPSRLEIAHSDRILDRMIGSGGAEAFTPGYELAAAPETVETA